MSGPGFEPPPAWLLPPGVDPALWRYSQTPRLAVEEDDYFSGHPLFSRDSALVDDRFTAPGRLVDLGCGAGRHSVRFAARGFAVTAVDLSRAMLETVGRKGRDLGLEPGRLRCVQANLCRLDCLPEASFDYALSLFSTLGMIRSAPARAEALGQAFRLLRPGGRLAIHAHNLWLNLGDPQGRRWLLGQIARRLTGRGGERGTFGDRRMDYRGVAGMAVHLFRWRELAGLLRGAGFRIDEAIPLDRTTAATIPAPSVFPSIRAGGWIVFAHRPGG